MSKFEIFACAIVGVVLPAFIYAVYKSEKAWLKYAKDHNCVVVSYVPSFPLTQTVFINGVPNVVTTYTPSSTTYKCDDGETITR